LSKLSQLKQDAYQAGKKKDWDLAVSIYERILDLEKNNPTTINEMGDLCLKAGEPSRAISHFLKAASKYRSTGLLNNAVAIYKKILRHDATNLNAHWYLAETRASQGLLQEGEEHCLQFLESSSEVTGDLQEIFLKRCCELFELYPESVIVLEKLLQAFRTWDRALEASRTQCLLACHLFDSGNTEQAREAMARVLERTPEVANYPEYGKWNNRVNPVTSSGGTFSDFGEVSLEKSSDYAAGPQAAPDSGVPAGDEPAAGDSLGLDLDSFGSQKPDPKQAEPAPPAPSGPVVSPARGGDESSFGDLQIEVDRLNAPDAEPETAVEVRDDDGCISLDDEDCFSLDEDTGGGSFDELIAQCTADLPAEENPPVDGSDSVPEVMLDPSGDDLVGDQPATPAADFDLLGGGETDKGAKVDLLAEILAEESDHENVSDDSQLDTISKEIGAQIGGADLGDDASQLYEMGLVYLEMGLIDQACESLARAAKDPEYALRAYEMWGQVWPRRAARTMRWVCCPRA
jgi:tetratricopeptide (TPR) repeat protein